MQSGEHGKRATRLLNYHYALRSWCLLRSMDALPCSARCNDERRTCSKRTVGNEHIQSACRAVYLFSRTMSVRAFTSLTNATNAIGFFMRGATTMSQVNQIAIVFWIRTIGMFMFVHFMLCQGPCRLCLPSSQCSRASMATARRLSVSCGRVKREGKRQRPFIQVSYARYT